MARIWDTNEGKQLGRELPATTGSLPFFAPGGELIALPGPGGYTVWDYGTDAWPQVACTVAGRNLTREEWTADGPGDVPYRATCDEYPIEG